MRSIRVALSRLAGAFRGRRAEAELDEELEAHLEMETADYVRRGMTPEDARRKALMSSGGLTRAAEAVRDQRGLPWLESLASDVRYALRALRQSPAFTTVVVLTLALGIGANTAIFSVIRGVLLKPLPHRDDHRLVYLRQSTDRPGGASLAFSVPEVRDLKNGAPSLGSLAEYSSWTATYQGEDGAVRLSLGLVTGNYFEVMGLRQILGRLTGPSDDGAGAPLVMVLTHESWLRRFGGDSTVIGRQLLLDRRPVTVIGVLEPAPFFPGRADAIANMPLSEHHMSAFMVEGRTHRMTEIVARLVPGASVRQARSEVQTVYARMQSDHREAYDPGSNYRVAVLPFREALGERAETTLWLLMGAAAFVMIISAANVANLTLMRGVRREHELVVRAALGAGVSRLRRLLLVENLVLALSGAVLGTMLAIGGVKLLTSFAARYSPRANEIQLDATVLGFAVMLSAGVALLLSFLASLPREGGFASWILAGAHRLTGRLGRQRLQRSLVVVQVAVSVVLLAGAGLLTRTMMQLADVETGISSEEVLTMTLQLLTPTDILTNPAADAGAKSKLDLMRREVMALPGVIEVGVGSTVPLKSTTFRLDLKVEGKPLAAGEAMPNAEFRTASPEYFRASGIPLLVGREFAPTDERGTTRVVILNKTMADRFFPGEDPIGRRIAWTGEVLKFTPISTDWRTIVGVVGNTQDGGLDAKPALVVFVPFAQELALGSGLIVRVDSNAAAMAPTVTKIVQRTSPATPIENVLTISQIKEQSVSPRRLNAALVSTFGLLALLIAAVGIAGVLAFSVSARTGEIGIRMSLGAGRGRVQRMILREGGVLLVIGLAAGVVSAVFFGRVIQGMLFGVAPHDPTTFVSVAVTMGAIGLLACWIPALRASRIDPAITMRS